MPYTKNNKGLIGNIKTKRGCMQRFIKQLAVTFVLSLCFSFFAVTVYAQTASSGKVCDPEYMHTLEKRAWMQAQREIELNANLITKPDSVLQLTCFSKFLGNAADTSGFFNNGDEVDMETVVSGALAGAYGYLHNGFQFGLMGGQTTDSGSEPGVMLSSLNEERYPEGDEDGCRAMMQLWKNVQCTNMGTPPESARGGPDYGALFPDLEEFVTSEDKRYQPTQCSAIAPDTKQGWGRALARMKTRAVEEGANVEIRGDSYRAAGPTEGYFDSVELFRSQWAPQSETGSCSSGIPTGVRINPSGRDPYDEKICPNPGCYYSLSHPGGAGSEGCKPIE